MKEHLIRTGFGLLVLIAFFAALGGIIGMFMWISDLPEQGMIWVGIVIALILSWVIGSMCRQFLGVA